MVFDAGPVPVQLREVGADEVSALQELIEADPGYTERITGHPPGASDALSLLMMRPEGVTEDAKLVLGAWDGAALVGVVDMVRGYPDSRCAFVGLLQVRWELQRGGVGRAVWAAAESWLRRAWPEVERVRLAVVDTNEVPAARFWAAVGFRPTGEYRPYRYDKLASTTRFWEKPL